MANPFHGNMPKKDTGATGSKPPSVKPGHRPDATPEGTADWPGVPGKTQPRSRDKTNTPKVKQFAKSEGI